MFECYTTKHNTEPLIQAMTERPGTCFLQYPKVPINSCNSFFDGGTCICSNSFKVSGGTTALPASTKYPKFLFLYLVLDIFQAELKFLLHVMLPITAAASPTFSWESSSIRVSSIYWYSFTSRGS